MQIKIVKLKTIYNLMSYLASTWVSKVIGNNKNPNGIS